VRAERLALLGRPMERPNARRGAALRASPAGAFAGLPGNRAEVIQIAALADRMMVQQGVAASPEADPFNLPAIYPFATDNRITRVEFVR